MPVKSLKKKTVKPVQTELKQPKETKLVNVPRPNNIKQKKENDGLTEDQIVKQDVIKLLGYDVFASADYDDQKFLYNELINYLDEDTMDDIFKISVVTQIVQNNNQIRKIDNEIARINWMVDSKKFSELTNIKQKIVMSNDKLAKENAISIKNRGDKSAGRSTLTYMLKQYRELNFDDAEVDYYDECKAYGMKVCADISNKSLAEQIQFDENDKIDIIEIQRKLVEEATQKVADLEEVNRQLHKQIQLLELEVKNRG